MSLNSMDNLAANGIINFDADAYVNGTPPRYIGNPGMNAGLPFEAAVFPGPCQYGITPGPLLSGHPSKDAFITKSEHGHSLLGSNKLLAGGIIAALAATAYSKVKSTFSSKSKDATKSGGWISSIKEKISSLFNKTPEVKAETKVVEKAVEKTPGFFRRNIGKFGLGAVGLLGLYGLYQYLSASKSHALGQMQGLHGLQMNEALAHRNNMQETPEAETQHNVTQQPQTH